jgi:hypothetical protein
MDSYLQEYGASDERRIMALKWGILALLVAAVIGIIVYFQLRDRSEIARVEQFLSQLRAGDYRAAYITWGCTESAPCTPQYSFEAFLEDWGPRSPHARADEASLGEKKSCDSGVIQFVHFPGTEDTALWLERDEPTIGFSPFTVCDPHVRPRK